MFKFIKWTIGILFTFTLIGGVIIIAATHFLNPNDFKPMLTKALSTKIGHPIDIKGELTLSIFPNIAFSAENIQIKNKENFSRPLLAEVQNASLNIQLNPLFKKEVKINALQIKGLKLFLEKNTAGEANWINNKNNLSKNLSKTSTTNESNSTSANSFDLSVAQLTVEQAQIEYIDQPNLKRFQIKDANFKTENILTNATALPIDLDFKFVQQQEKTITLSADARIKGKLNFSSLNKIQLKDTDATLTLKTTQGQQIPVKLNGNLEANILTNTFSLKQLTLKIDESLAKGDLSVQLADRIKFIFDLNIDKLDLTKYQSPPKIAYQFSPIKTAYAATPHSQLINKGLAQQYELSGNLKIESLKIAKLSLSDVKLTARTIGKQGFDFAPITAKLYSGQFNGQVYVDLKTNNPLFQFLGQAFNIDIAAFLDDLNGKHALSGNSQVTFDLHSAGLDKEKFIRNLNGNMKIDLNKGYLEGIDIPYYYQYAQSLIKKQQDKTISNTNRTEIKTLTATIFSHNGVFVNDDLLLTAPQFKVNGRGKIFLAEQNLEYAVIANKTNEEGESKDGNIAVALKIKGPLESPKVTPDLEAMAKPVIKNEIKKQLDKQINKIFKF